MTKVVYARNDELGSLLLMIHLHNLKKQFGSKIIFDGASAHIPPKTRVGLVGPNGSGKTTLFRMLIGEEEIDGGSIVITKGARLGYLKQEVWENPNRSILAETLAGFPELQKMEQDLTEMERQMAGKHQPELLERYGKLRQRFEAQGGYEVEHQAKAILSGMGFRPGQFVQPLKEFSGGWMMRIALAKLLLARPEVLLLDEPTNHLDLEAIVWLENFLLEYPGAVVLTTHDQVFMQRIAGRILEISRRKLHTFVGGFEDYVEEKVARQEQLEAQYRTQQKKIEQTERFIERFRYKATKARQVQSRIKMLAKMERVEIVNDAPRAMKFRLPQPPRSGQEVVQLSKVTKRYGDKTVYDNLDFTLLRREKVALLGPNGAGKSTLLKIIAHAVDIQAGAVLYGQHVTLDYYAQHQLEILNSNATILEELTAVTPHLTPEQRRTLLGAFLFSGDEVFKPISVLSGGEKARVALAKLLSRSANLLVMDEPTNHLDILSRQVLEDALADYEGTLIFISHDRAFINAIANRIVEITNGKLRSFPGNYDEYIWRKEREAGETNVPATAALYEEPAHSQKEIAPSRSKKEGRRARAERIQERSRQLKPLQGKLAVLEEEIAALEKEKKELTAALCDPTVIADSSVYPQKLRRHREIETILQNRYDEWASLAQEIEEVHVTFADLG